nr:MAG TPA: hypothetical protein [Caudoviricetes sp.]
MGETSVCRRYGHDSGIPYRRECLWQIIHIIKHQ